MRNSSFSCVLCSAAVAVTVGAVLPPAGPAAAANLNFNFNNGEEGWLATPASTDPAWLYNGGPSSKGGGWQGFIGSPQPGSVAYLLSPCLEILQNDNQHYLHADLSHEYSFPSFMQGQLQYTYSLQGVWSNQWRVVPNQTFTPNPPHDPTPNDDGWVTDNEHDAPTAVALSPLLPGMAFAGISDHVATGGHGNSGFFLQWSDIAPGFGNGDEIMFRFALGTVGESAEADPLVQVWEINSLQFDGVRLCDPDPPVDTAPQIDPANGGTALAVLAAVLAMIERRRRRGPVLPAA